jgi:hypothetical protein
LNIELLEMVRSQTLEELGLDIAAHSSPADEEAVVKLVRQLRQLLAETPTRVIASAFLVLLTAIELERTQSARRAA